MSLSLSAHAALSFRPEMLDDAPAIEGVLDRAFGPGRFAKPSERVREFARLERRLSRCLWRDRALIGCCRIYAVQVGAAPALFLGPLAIDPAEQRHGWGHRLVDETLKACRAARAQAIILMGEPSFFSTLGFSPVPQARIGMPVPFELRRLQWIELEAGTLEALHGPISAPLDGR